MGTMFIDKINLCFINTLHIAWRLFYIIFLVHLCFDCDPSHKISGENVHSGGISVSMSLDFFLWETLYLYTSFYMSPHWVSCHISPYIHHSKCSSLLTHIFLRLRICVITQRNCKPVLGHHLSFNHHFCDHWQPSPFGTVSSLSHDLWGSPNE
jgi:hypothetical protein